MANKKHLDILKQGVDVWNKWRKEHPKIIPDLRGTDLRGANLSRANLYNTSLRGTDLSGAHLSKVMLWQADLSEATLLLADLSRANLSDANLILANLIGANLIGATLRQTNLIGANLSHAYLNQAHLWEAYLDHADLSGADLSGASLYKARLLQTNFKQANLIGCHIYGISAWNVKLEGAKQENLVITDDGEPIITVDNLKVAQFIYLLLNNSEIREVIDTIARKVVLILGRFTPERKVVLDALRDELRKHNYSPVTFDFEKPASRDLTEIVSILARLSRFIIADITDPGCIPQELYAVVPDCIVPVQPLLSSQPVLIDGNEVERRPYSMFKDLQRRYHWVLPTYRYQDTDQLLSSIKDNIITPAEEKGRELERRKNGFI